MTIVSIVLTAPPFDIVAVNESEGGWRLICRQPQLVFSPVQNVKIKTRQPKTTIVVQK